MTIFLKVISIAVGLVIVIAIVLTLFGVDPKQGLTYLWQGAAGDWIAIGRSLTKATPLILCGLGVVIAWKAGMYNIGAEGQYIFGGIGGALCGKYFLSSSGLMFPPIALTAGAIFGAAVGFFAGWLHVKRGVQVVISTILLNFVAILTLEYLLRGPLQESRKQIFVTDTVPNSQMLLRFDRQSDLHVGVFLALSIVVITYVFLTHTLAGFRIRACGSSPRAARVNGIEVEKYQLLAMALSGGLCGLAGAVTYVGVTGRLADGFSEGWGFYAIPVALLSGLNPFGVLANSIYFGGLFAGSDVLKRFTPIGNSIVPAVQGAAVLAFVAINYGVMMRKKNKEVL